MLCSDENASADAKCFHSWWLVCLPAVVSVSWGALLCCAGHLWTKGKDRVGWDRDTPRDHTCCSQFCLNECCVCHILKKKKGVFWATSSANTLVFDKEHLHPQGWDALIVPAAGCTAGRWKPWGAQASFLCRTFCSGSELVAARQAEGRVCINSAQQHRHVRALGLLLGAEDFQQVLAPGFRRRLGSNYSDILLSDQLKFHNLSTRQSGQCYAGSRNIF